MGRAPSSKAVSTRVAGGEKWEEGGGENREEGGVGKWWW